jgi:hypothetical protein
MLLDCTFLIRASASAAPIAKSLHKLADLTKAAEFEGFKKPST